MRKKSDRKATTFGVPDKNIAIGFLALVHFSGALLLMFSKGGIYRVTLDLVPVTLALSFLISLKFHSEFNAGFFTFCFLTFIIGLLAEMLGTNLGWIFGNYSYGDVLGAKLWNTPIMIGVNWLLLAYGIGMLMASLNFNRILKWILATAAMVLFDYFMEPVAIRHGFWEWHDGNIPLENYMGWAIISGIVSAAFLFFSFEKKNKVAGPVWLLQFGFFVIQNLF